MLSHLLQRYATKWLKDILAALPSDKQRIAYLAEKIAEITELKDFPQYLTLLLKWTRCFSMMTGI